MPIPARGANPYLKLLYTRLEHEGIRVLEDEHFFLRLLSGYPGSVPSFIHYHWPENRYGHDAAWRLPDRALWFFSRLQLQKRLGTQVIWTMHNWAPHENTAPEFHRRAKARMLAMSDIVLVNFHEAKEKLAREYGRHEAVYVLPHGSYRGYYPDHIGRLEARAQLNLAADHFVFLVFGDLRAYKNTELVLRAFARNPNPRLRLVIAGAARHAEYGRHLQSVAQRDPRVLLKMERIPDDQVQVFFRASDVLLLGQETFSSGSAILGLDFDLPLLGRHIHHLAEVAQGEAVFDLPALTEDAIADGIRHVSEADLDQARRDATRSSLALAWPPIGEQFAEILRRHAAKRAH